MDKKLYLIPTPIGNLEDITLRALRLLKEVDCVLAEDTRTSGNLMKHFEINTPLRSYHMHNEHKVTPGIIDEMLSGKTFGLITDAGTPGISDPGFLLVKACIENQIPFEVLPGASALIPALINSGFPNHNFLFEGFLPAKKGRQKKMKQLAGEIRTVVIYESPYKLVRTLEDIRAYMGNPNVSISRELSKKFEETLRGKASVMLDYFKSHLPKGEFVICIEARPSNQLDLDSDDDMTGKEAEDSEN